MKDMFIMCRIGLERRFQMARRRRKKKRTLTSEQLQKMQEGRERKKKHQERLEQVRELDGRLRKGYRIYKGE